MKKIPAMSVLQIKTTARWPGGATSIATYASNANGAITPATPIETAIAVIAELSRMVAMEGQGGAAILAATQAVTKANDWKIENGYAP